MKTIRITCLILCLSAWASGLFGQGVCFHAYSPDAPDNQIQFFEFDRFERNAEGYRFFMRPTGSVVVTNYRYRGAVIYNDNLNPGHPDFEKQLETYENAVKKVPGTARLLGTRIQTMRDQQTSHKNQQQAASELPSIVIAGEKLTAPVYQRLEDGRMVVAHGSGVSRIPLSRITDQEYAAFCELQPKAAGKKIETILGTRLWNPEFSRIEEGMVIVKHAEGTSQFDLDRVDDTTHLHLIKIDPKASKMKVYSVNGRRIWNPVMERFHDKIIQIKHEKGTLELNYDEISDEDKETITSWSDGTWKIALPGFYRSDPGDRSYDEVILNGGIFFSKAELESRVKDQVTIRHAGGELQVAIGEIVSLEGILPNDSEKISQWVTEIIEERFRAEKPTESIKRLSFEDAEVVRLTNVRARVLQVLDGGILTSDAVGELFLGTSTDEVTMTIHIEHPVTGQVISREVGREVVRNSRSQNESLGLCFIIWNNENLVDGDMANIKSMKLDGRYQYLDTHNVQRTVSKYKLD